MKNYKVKATRSFTDGVENIIRNIDDEFECTKGRYEELLSHNAVELIEIQTTVEEIIEEVKEEVKPIKKTNKKKSK